MKRRLSITAIIIMMNQVLTPFSYALGEDMDILNVVENVTVEEENTDDTQDAQQSGVNIGDESEGQEDDIDIDSLITITDETGDDVEDDLNTEDEDSEQAEEIVTETGEGEIEAGSNDIEISTGDIEEFTGDIEILTGDVLTGDVVEPETGSVLTGDIEELTGDIEQLTGEALTGYIEVTTGDNEILTGDVLTGDVEILTGNVEELTGDIEQLTGDILTGSAIDAVNETLEEIQAQRDAELAEIWKTLNEEVISGQEMYKDVIVSVEAPAGSFPSVAQLRITPITTKSQQQQIKDQLVENTDVTQESELVSFDISFVYTLSNGEEVELQPYTGQTVKVSFNFTYNDTLSQADSDSDKELKVYHLEEVKDEKGKKTDEVEVKEVEVNKSESSDGELVVDAEKFSIYTIVTQQFEEPQTTSTWRLGVDYNEIVTQNGSNCITIMDRNLGATTTGAGASAPTTSYGYYYQWGNNYGFTTDTAQANNTSVKPDVSSYSNSNYYSKSFVAGSNGQWMSSWNDNLWGGGDDAKSNTWGEGIENFEGRQGPCPNGWHVPSTYEISLLIEYYGQSVGTNGATYKGLNYTTDAQGFISKYYIPYHGFLLSSGKPSGQGSNFYIISSSPYNSWKVLLYRLYSSSKIDMTSQNAHLGFPVRCFKNTYECKSSSDCELDDGTIVSNGDSITAYQNPIVAQGSTCQSETVTCNNGTLNGTYRYSSCSVSGQTGSVAEECNLPWGGTAADGTTVTGYQSASVTYGQSCVGVSATCNDGNWSVENFTGTYLYSGCSIAEPATCSFQGQTIAHNGSLTVYSTSSTTCPTTCTAGTVTCTNGELGGDTSYTNLTCSPTAVTCDASYTLTTTGAHGTYSSCTPYTASSNTCTAGTTVYKLDSCDTGYHTEDNATCVSNTNSVACDASGTPANATADSYDVTITWNGSSWSSPAACTWSCNSHYHKNQTETACEIDTYQITWKDGDGNTLKTDTVNWNVVPSYSGDTPTKTQDAQYTYTFNNTWSPNPVAATADATYTAQFDSNLRSYTITWLNDDNSLIDTTTVEYGVVPTHASGTKANTAEYTYTFAGWTPSPVSVTGSATYKATFSATKNKYLITFKNRDGNQLQSSEVEYGSTPSYSGTPTRPATAEFTYTFAGWSPEISSVTQAQVYTATYNSTVNNYTVTVRSNNTNSGTVDRTSVVVPYGTGITINGDKVTIGTTVVTATPKTQTEQWTYSFENWTNTCGATVSTGCTITANFKSTLRSYTVTWKNEDGTTLETDNNVSYGTTPTYNSATPTKSADNTYTYTFAGWSPAIHSVTGAQVYTATYTPNYIDYTITFKDYDGTQISTSGYHYGDTVTVPADPTRAADNIYTYSFTGWSPSVSNVTKSQVYTATYNETYIDYTITFVNYDDSEISSNTYHYGDTVIQPANPSKPSDNTYTYTFAGWDSEVVAVNGNKTYKATYTPNYINYTITFKDYDGRQISTSGYHYGDTVTVPADPTRAATAEFTYTFNGWNPSVTNVTKSQVYTATYISTINQYTATIAVTPSGYGTVSPTSVKKDYNSDIVINGTTLTIGGTTVTPTPTPASAEWTYSFSGWINACGNKLTGNCTITAEFTRTKNNYTVNVVSNNTNSGTVTTGSIIVPYGTSISTSSKVLTVGTQTSTANPREQTQQYYFYFVDWDTSDCGATVSTGCRVIANFDSNLRTYTVQFLPNNPEFGKINDSNVSSTTTSYGSPIVVDDANGTVRVNSPVVATATPTSSDAQYTYTFVGWTNGCGDELTGNCIITGNFERTTNQYQITFNSNGGSSVASQTKYYGETVTKPNNPTRDGYNFSGWYSNPELTNEYHFTETITGALTLYAKWTAKGYAITYILNNGVVPSANPTSYTIESDIIILTNPTRTGYEFKGWTGTDLDGLTMSVTISHGSTGNRIYEANWEAKDVEITINHHLQDLNANTNTLLNTYSDYKTLTGSEEADSTITLANYKLTNITGFVYDYGKVNGTQTTTTTVLPDGSRVIDLYYTRNQYSFTLNSATGATTVGSSTSQNYYYGANITLSGDISGDCYMWSGWNIVGANSTSNKQTSFTMPANAVTVTPVVTEKTYNIIFDGTTKTSGTTSSMNNVKCTTTVALNANGFEKTGYTFSGWATTSGGAKVYNDKQSVTTLSTTNNANVTLYAVWTANPDTPYQVIHRYLDVNGNRDDSNKRVEDLTGTSDSTITPDFISKDGFNDPVQKITTTIAADGGSVVNYEYSRKYYKLHFVTTGTAVAERDVIYGGALNVDETSAISGYTFLGWSPNPTEMTMPLSGLTLTATWRANPDTKYKVEHYQERLGGGYYPSPTDTDNLTGTTDQLTHAVAKDYEGFTLSGNIEDYQENINGNESTVVKIYYTRDTHTITFVKDNGEADYVVTAKYSGDVTPPANPSKEGYTFAGWDKTVPTKMPAEDMTITAQWQINQYTITFNTNGGTTVADITLDYNSSITAPANPTKTGYTFAGWDKEIPARMPAEDMTINADWTINTYEIRFVDSEGRYNDVVYTGDYNSSTSSITKPNWTKTGYTIHWDKEIPNPMPATGTVITATWDINQYTISFYPDGGTSVPSVTQDYNTIIEEEPVTTKAGYTFTGWYDENGRVEFPYYIPAENKTLTGHWDINQYTITFDSNGGTDVDSITQDYNTQVTKPTDPTRTGYTFGGWYNNNTLVVWPYTLTNKDETFVADWTINQYTITFDTDGGTPVAPKTQDYDTILTAPKDPTKIGYTFGGWNPDLPAKMPANNLTAVAQWDIVTYEIDYELYGGTNNPDNRTGYTIETPAFTITGATRTGYTFLGWTGSNGETAQKTITIGKGNYGYRHYFANWSLDTYTITYNMNGGTNNSNNPSTYTYESDIITLANPTRTGYIFSGWTEEGISTPTKGVQIPTHSVGNKEYTAIWDLDTYGIFYELDGGTNNQSNPSTYTYESNTITLGDPTKTGYTFLGWTGEGVTSPTKGVQIPVYSVGNKTYYANWEANVYKLNYIEYGGELAPNTPKTAIYDAVFTINHPSRTGYTFSGWKIYDMDSVEHTIGNSTTTATSIDSTNATNFKNLTSISGSEVQFKAQWNQNQYNILYSLDGGEFGDRHPDTAIYDTTFYVDNPTKVGYVFSGWKITGMNSVEHTYGSSTTTATTIDNTKEVSFKNLHSITNANVTFTALWAPIEYTITYNLDGGVLNEGETNPTKYTIETPTFVLKTPSKTGYDFSGWVDGSGNFVKIVTVEQGSIGDKNYTAIYTVHKWSLKFLQDTTPIYSGIIAYGDPIVIPNTGSISKEGYHFTGWTPSPVPATMPDNNLTFSVVWEVNTHTVTYVSEGQTFETFNDVAYGTTIPQPNTTPTKIGHHFVKWSGDVSLTDTMPDTDLTFTAVFEKNDYKVTLNANPTSGGSVHGAGTYKYNDSITVTGVANYGFTFSGWKAGNDFVSRDAVYTFTADAESGITLVAVFDINYYDVSVEVSEDKMGTVAGSGRYQYMTQVPLLASNKQGYHFVKWTNSNGDFVADTPTYIYTVTQDTGFIAVFEPNTDTPYVVNHYRQDVDGNYPETPTKSETLYGTSDVQVTPDVETYEGFTAPATQTVTIAATGSTVVNYYYTRNVYTITFNTNGGTPVATITGRFESVVPSVANPTKTGYTFTGWSETIPSTMPAEDMTISAGWKINQYTIHFNTDGGTDIADITQDYDTVIDKPANPTKVGYTFSGWDKAIPDRMPATGMIITALWGINQYTITFDTDGGTPVASITQDYNTNITKPADPEKTGYNFAGWTPSIPTTMPAYSQTITGTWTPRDDTKYVVVHMKQQLDNSYATGDVYTGQGTTNTSVTPAVKTYDGFTSPSAQTVNIEPDGSRVVIYLYTRNSYSLTFDTAGGTALSGKTLKFEEPIGTIATTTKTGYHLAENVAEAWINYPNGGKMPATGLILIADWIPNPDTPYTIKHYQQNINGSYPTNPTDTDNLTGETASEFLPKVKDYHGFEAPDVETGTIAADGSTVVELYYTRLTYTVNYLTDGGDSIDSTGVIFGDTIPTPTPQKTGFDFVKWSGLPNDSLMMPDYEVDLTAIWTPSKNTPYRVEYWLEDIQTGHYTLYTGLNLTGTTNANVTPAVPGHTGFNSPEPQTKSIAPEGNMLIVYQYTRKSFILSYNVNGGEPELSEREIRYQDQIITGEVTRPGYTFEKWDNYPTDGKMPAGNLQLKAKWLANTNTLYTVEHYVQHLNDTGYDLRETETLRGTTDQLTAAFPKHYPGWTATFNTGTDQLNINGDESTVVKIYYDRDTYRIIYDMAGGDPIETGFAKFDTPLESILSGLNPTRLGYDFYQWNGLDGENMPAADLYLTAEWTARDDTPYTVNHYREDITIGQYTLHETENLSGVTDSVINVPIKIYTGFKNPTIQTGKVIAVPEGETGLVVNYYYNRDSFTLTYDVDGGAPVSVANPVPVRYEVTINTGVTTTKTGYIFSGWSNVPENGKMPAKALTIKAIWEPDVVNYTVQHKLQSIDDENNYELSGSLTQTLTGKSESRTQAVARDLSGFTAQTVTQKKIDPNGTTVVEIRYIRQSYTISFNSKGGTSIESITDKYDSDITAPANPTKTGYTFSGWNPSVPARMPAQDTELMAEWINNKYTVSFNANGGQGTTPTLTATYDERFTLTANGFTRKGYTFSGWAMSENGGKVYGDGEEIRINLASESGANVVLYAVWDLDTYNINYHLNGGSVAGTNPTKYDVNSGAITLINPTREGYTFEGWTGTDLNSATQTVIIPSGSTGDREYIATWKTITYHIVYDANSGVLADNPTEYTIESGTFIIHNPTRTGYKFVGWSGTDLDEVSDNVTISQGSIGDRSYIANWEARDDTEYLVKHYQEQLDGNYKLVTTETLTGTTDQETQAVAKTYDGFIVQSFSQTIITADEMAVVRIDYNRRYYDVIVEGERGIQSIIGTGSYKYQQPVTVTVNVKSGYTIEGVTEHYDYDVEVGLDGNVIRPNINVITYNITYNLNQGIITGSNPTKYNVETGFTLINPTRTGYDFAGWTGTDLTEKTINVIVNTGSIGNRNYVANWTSRNDTEYKVNHVYEGIETTPEETITKTHTGISDTTVTGQLAPRTGFNSPAEQPIYIEADGTAEITYYYDRTKYTVTYDSNGGIDVNPWTGKYGATIPREELSRDGYRFDGWSGATTVPAENTGLVAQWTALDVNYVVKHMQQNANDNNYTESESETLTGTTDTDTDVTAKVYSGFKLGVFTNVKINGDGSTVVEVKYDREVYTITFNSSGGTAVDPITGKYEQNLTAPSNPKLSGYTFIGWEPEFPTKMPLDGTGLKAIWKANTGTLYTVKHFFEDLSGNYIEDSSFENELRGTTNTETEAVAKIVAGFTPQTIAQEIINGDGSTVVEVNYDRNEYRVTYNANGGTEVESWTGKYEAAIPNKATSRSGYDFVEWTGATNVPADNITVTAVWKARSDTEYTVKHMQQNADDDNYTEFESETLTGTTEELTDAQAKVYSGFKAGVFENAIISGNGSTIVEIRYQREVYDITFDTSTGTHVDTISAKYGANITSQRPVNPELSGYDFVDWEPEFPSIMPLNGTELTAIWDAHLDTPYTVKHFFEDLDGNDIENEDYREILTGKTDTLTNAKYKDVAGFSGKSLNQVNIDGNGQAIATVYYSRNSYTVMYDSKGGISVANKEFKYEEEIERPTITRDGYTFKGWTGAITMPAENTGLTAIWEPKTNTHYTVEHYQQNILDDEYTIEDTEDKIGTTEDNTAATGNNYPGFTMKPFDQQPISGNGSTVIRIYYDRNVYKLTFDTSTGTDVAPITGRYGADIGTIPEPELSGYTFKGWENYPEGGTIPVGDRVLTAIWEANTGTAYTVEHYLQWLDGIYPGSPNYIDNLSGTTDTQTNAVAMSLSGFTVQSFTQTGIKGDETTVVRIFYTRDTYTVSYQYVNQPAGASTLPVSSGYLYEQTVAVANGATAPGYNFVWSRTGTFTMPAENVVITGLFTARNDTPYTVEYYYQQADGTYLGTATVFTGRVAETDTTVYVTDQDKIPVESGYTFDASAANVLEGVVNGNGTLILKVYFKKQFTVTYKPGDKGTFEEEVYSGLDYGIETPLFLGDKTQHLSGYTFLGWSPSVASYVTDNVIYVADWSANKDTPYTVIYTYEGTNDGILPITIEIVYTGTTDTEVPAPLLPKDGFKDPEQQNITILGNGSAIGTYIYERKQYQLNYNTSGGTAVSGVMVAYEGLNPKDRVTTRTGYTFVEWTGDERMPLNGTTLTAVWTPNTGTEYKVVHIYTGTNDGVASETVTVTHSGTTDTRVTGQLAPRSGFITPETEQVFIEPDGSASMTYVYERTGYTLTYDANGGRPVAPVTITYGALNDKGAETSRTGYTFVEWTGDERMPLNGTTLTAVWTPNTGTKYRVNHRGENIGDNEYGVLLTGYYMYGTSDTQTKARSMIFSGFTLKAEPTQANIEPDGSRIIDIYYDRNEYTITFDTGSGSTVGLITDKYEAPISAPANPSRTGYQFSGWNPAFPSTMPLSGAMLVAEWTANTGTTYYVYHYQENIAGTGYDLIEVEELSGTTDTSVTPNTKTYEGFTSPSGIEINIDPDGNAIVRYYYSRNSYNLKVKDRDEVLVDEDVKYGDVIQLPEDPTWTGHTFIRWSNVPADGKMPADAIEIVAVWDTNTYTITFDMDGGSELAPITGNYGDPIIPPATPTKDGYRFVGWEPEIPETMPDHDMTIKAIWERNGRSGGGGRGNGGTSDQHGSADDQQLQGGTGSDVSDVDPEVLAAYQWAYKNGITTLSGLENANPDGLIPRGHMAKMVTNFAVNVLGREIPEEIPAECSWGDTDWESEEIKDYAVKSCALGVMGIYMEDFLPNKILDRAELGTIISRLLWGDTYNVIDTNNRPYYVEHLKELKNEGIMTQIQNPEARKELRKWAWVMLMRVQQ